MFKTLEKVKQTNTEQEQQKCKRIGQLETTAFGAFFSNCYMSKDTVNICNGCELPLIARFVHVAKTFRNKQLYIDQDIVAVVASVLFYQHAERT